MVLAGNPPASATTWGAGYILVTCTRLIEDKVVVRSDLPEERLLWGRQAADAAGVDGLESS